MDRRAFLGVAAASSVPLPAVPKRGPGRPLPPPPLARPGPVDDMDAYLTTVDEGMRRIAAWSITADHPDFAGDREATDALARSAMQTLYLTGMFGDLPREQQLHPGMQERMWAALPLMDDALDRMNVFLDDRTDDELARVHRALSGATGVSERIGERLAAEAARCGTSPWRCQQLRAIVSQAGWRLANQPPELLIGEYRSKIERVDGSDIAAAARERWLAGKVGEGVFWARAALEPTGRLGLDAVADTATSTRDKRIARGVKAMGIGVLIFGVGALIAASSGNALEGAGPAGLVIGTVGAIWFLVGLVILLGGLSTPGPAPAPSKSGAPR